MCYYVGIIHEIHTGNRFRGIAASPRGSTIIRAPLFLNPTSISHYNEQKKSENTS